MVTFEEERILRGVVYIVYVCSMHSLHGELDSLKWLVQFQDTIPMAQFEFIVIEMIEQVNWEKLG